MKTIHPSIKEIPIELIKKIRRFVREGLNQGVFRKEEEITSFIEHECATLLNTESRKIVKSWYKSIFYYFDRVEMFAASLETNEIHFQHNQSVIYLNKEKIIQYDDYKIEDYQLILEVFLAKKNLILNSENPFLSAGLKSSRFPISRLTMTHASLHGEKSSKGYWRFFNEDTVNLSSFVQSKELQNTLRQMIVEKKNLFICGATGSGKTTFMRSLLETHSLSNDEHIITLEDLPELQLGGKNTTSMIADEKVEGKRLVDYCHYLLRMRPDRIVLGEVRGPELVPLLLNMNTGHRGTMATFHASGAVKAIDRLAELALIYSDFKKEGKFKLMKLICSNLDYVLFVRDKKIAEIIEIHGCDEGTPIFDYLFKETSGSKEKIDHQGRQETVKFCPDPHGTEEYENCNQNSFLPEKILTGDLHQASYREEKRSPLRSLFSSM